MSESSASLASRTSAPGQHHPAQDERIVEGFKTSHALKAHLAGLSGRSDADRNLVPRRSPRRPEEHASDSLSSRPEWAKRGTGRLEGRSKTARRSALRPWPPICSPAARSAASAGASERTLARFLCRHRQHDAAAPPHDDEISEHSARRQKGCRHHCRAGASRQGWVAHHPPSSELRHARKRSITPIFLPSRAPGAEPGRERLAVSPSENFGSLSQTHPSSKITTPLSTLPALDAWRKLTAKPETITSIGMRDWAVGQSL